MILSSFQPGMIVECFFQFPGEVPGKPVITRCVVMAVHVKGILVHPVMGKETSDEAHAVYTAAGRVACDIRNVVETPGAYVVAQRTTTGRLIYAQAQLGERDFAALRAKSLDCAYAGTMRSERLRADPRIDRMIRDKAGVRALQQPSVTERGHRWAALSPRTGSRSGG